MMTEQFEAICSQVGHRLEAMHIGAKAQQSNRWDIGDQCAVVVENQGDKVRVHIGPNSRITSHVLAAYGLPSRWVFVRSGGALNRESFSTKVWEVIKAARRTHKASDARSATIAQAEAQHVDIAAEFGVALRDRSQAVHLSTHWRDGSASVQVERQEFDTVQEAASFTAALRAVFAKYGR